MASRSKPPVHEVPRKLAAQRKAALEAERARDTLHVALDGAGLHGVHRFRVESAIAQMMTAVLVSAANLRGA